MNGSATAIVASLIRCSSNVATIEIDYVCNLYTVAISLA